VGRVRCSSAFVNKRPQTFCFSLTYLLHSPPPASASGRSKRRKLSYRCPKREPNPCAAGRRGKFHKQILFFLSFPRSIACHVGPLKCRNSVTYSLISKCFVERYLFPLHLSSLFSPDPAPASGPVFTPTCCGAQLFFLELKWKFRLLDRRDALPPLRIPARPPLEKWSRINTGVVPTLLVLT